MPIKGPVVYEPKPCKVCSKPFTPRTGRQIICSDACRAAELRRTNAAVIQKRREERQAARPASKPAPRPRFLPQPPRAAPAKPAVPEAPHAPINLEPGMIEAVRGGIEHGTIRRYGFFLVIKGAGHKPVALVPDQSGPPSIKKDDVLAFVKRRPDGRWVVKTSVEGVQIWNR